MKTAPLVLFLLVCPLCADDRLTSRPRPQPPESKPLPIGEEEVASRTRIPVTEPLTHQGQPH